VLVIVQYFSSLLVVFRCFRQQVGTILAPACAVTAIGQKSTQALVTEPVKNPITHGHSPAKNDAVGTSVERKLGFLNGPCHVEFNSGPLLHIGSPNFARVTPQKGESWAKMGN